MNNQQNHQYANFNTPFPEDQEQYRRRGNINQYRPQSGSKRTKIKNWFTKSNEKDSMEGTNSEVYEYYHEKPNTKFNRQNQISRDNLTNNSHVNGSPNTEINQPQTLRYNIEQYYKKLDHDSSISNKTFLTSNRPNLENNEIMTPFRNPFNDSKTHSEYLDKKETAFPVRRNLLDNIQSVISDSHMGFKSGNIKSSDVVKRLIIYITKKNQNSLLLRKTINVLKNWNPQSDLYNKDDITLMIQNLIELFEDELKYEARVVQTLNSTLTKLQNISSKEEKYMISQKKMIVSVRKYESSLLKKNETLANNHILFESEMADNRKRFQMEQDLLQSSITTDLRKTYIFHTFENFTNALEIIEISKQKICSGLKELLMVNPKKFEEVFHVIRKERTKYNRKKLPSGEQENYRRQGNLRKGLNEKNDILLGHIYKEFPEIEIPQTNILPEWQPNLVFKTAIGESTTEVIDQLSDTVKTNTLNRPYYHNKPDIDSYDLPSNSTNYHYMKNEDNTEDNNKENKTFISTLPDYTKTPTHHTHRNINKGSGRQFVITTVDRYECNTDNLETNHWDNELM